MNRSRPLLITIAAIVMAVVGLLEIALGSVLVSNRNDASFRTDADMSSSRIGALGIALLVLGALSVLLALGLLRGSRVARFLLAIVNLANLCVGVFHLLHRGSGAASGAIGTIAGSLYVMYILYGHEKSKAFFA